MSYRKFKILNQKYIPALVLAGVLLLLMTTPAFAGTSGSTAGAGLVSMGREALDILRSDLVVVAASLAAALFMFLGIFGGLGDGMRKGMFAFAGMALVLMIPGIAQKFATAAGAVI